MLVAGAGEAAGARAGQVPVHLTGGGPGISTETLTLYAYQEGLKKFNLGYTSALSFTFLITVILMGLLYLAVLKPYVEKRA